MALAVQCLARGHADPAPLTQYSSTSTRLLPLKRMPTLVLEHRGHMVRAARIGAQVVGQGWAGGGSIGHGIAPAHRREIEGGNPALSPSGRPAAPALS